MGKVGVIAVIKKEYSAKDSPFENALQSNGYSRMPGTGNYMYPYKELGGKYRTGLDPDAGYIQRIKDKTEKEAELKRIKEDLEIIKSQLGDDFDVSPRSKYYNQALRQSDHDTSHVGAVKLKDGDNFFNLNDARELITFRWLSRHPQIATSMEDYLAGKCPPECQFYVKEENVEQDRKFRKKQAINNAISKLQAMSVEKQRKVATMLGLGVGDTTLPTDLYNRLDDYIHTGDTEIELFHKFANMNDDVLYAKYLLEMAIFWNIYRENRGAIEEGGITIGEDKESVVKWLLEDQKELIGLGEKVKQKKSLGV